MLLTSAVTSDANCCPNVCCGVHLLKILEAYIQQLPAATEGIGFAARGEKLDSVQSLHMTVHVFEGALKGILDLMRSTHAALIVQETRRMVYAPS